MNEILEILDRMEFFQGQRAGRELWASKPEKIQNEDIENFNRDIKKIRDYVLNNRKQMERIVKRLEEASYMTFPTFDEDGYSNDDSEEVVLLDTAIEIVKEEGGIT